MDTETTQKRVALLVVNAVPELALKIHEVEVWDGFEKLVSVRIVRDGLRGRSYYEMRKSTLGQPDKTITRAIRTAMKNRRLLPAPADKEN